MRVELLLNSTSLREALEQAFKNLEKVDGLGIGNLLLKAEGLRVVRTFKEKFQGTKLLVDARASSQLEVELLAEAGADAITILPKTFEASATLGVELVADLTPHKELSESFLKGLRDSGFRSFLVGFEARQQLKALKKREDVFILKTEELRLEDLGLAELEPIDVLLVERLPKSLKRKRSPLVERFDELRRKLAELEAVFLKEWGLKERLEEENKRLKELLRAEKLEEELTEDLKLLLREHYKRKT